MSTSVYSMIGLRTPMANILSPDYIIATICKYRKILDKDLLRKCRERRFVYPRQLCIYFLRRETSLSLKEIAYLLGYSDF